MTWLVNTEMPKRTSYTAAFKLKVLEYAEQHGKRAAGRHFGVDESNVRLWEKKKHIYQAIPESKKAIRGKAAFYPELEEELKGWIYQQSANGIAVSLKQLRVQAKVLMNEKDSENDFKASHNWCLRFMNRHRSPLSVHLRDDVAEKLPKYFKDRFVSSPRQVTELRKKLNIPLYLVGNADQILLSFNTPPDSSTSADSSPMSSKHETSQFTVMLCCLADGTKLPPFAVFKAQTLPEDTVYPSDILVRTQAEGQMDDNLCKDWVDNVWGSRPGGMMEKGVSLLVLDAFHCHRNPEFLQYIKAFHRTEVVIIPSRMTPMLPPLALTVNKLIKTALRTKWDEWMTDDVKPSSISCQARTPDLVTLCQWIRDAWVEVDSATIRHSFNECSMGAEDCLPPADDCAPHSSDSVQCKNESASHHVDEDGHLLIADSEILGMLEETDLVES